MSRAGTGGRARTGTGVAADAVLVGVVADIALIERGGRYGSGRACHLVGGSGARGRWSSLGAERAPCGWHATQ